MGKDAFEKTIFKNISSSGISIMVPNLSMDRRYSLPELKDSQDYYNIYEKFFELRRERYGKEIVSFNLAETTVLLEILTDIAGDNICYLMKCEKCEYGEINKRQLLDGVKKCTEHIKSNHEWYSKEKEFYLGCKNKWSDGWTDRDVATDCLKELEEFLSSARDVSVVIEDEIISCEHEEIWYASEFIRREMEMEKLKILNRMLEELNCLESIADMVRDGVMIDDGEGGEIPIEMSMASEELNNYIMSANDREMEIMFEGCVGRDLYNCFEDYVQEKIDGWLNL